MFSLQKLFKVILSTGMIMASYNATAFAADYPLPQTNVTTVSTQDYSKDIKYMYGAGRHIIYHFPAGEQRALPQFQPQEPASQKDQAVATNVSIQAGDSSVSASVIQTAGKIINDYSLPTLQNTVGLAPEKNVNIVLFSSYYTYAKALILSGMDSGSAQTLATNTSGLTSGTTIWIPLYNIDNGSELTNVLSHEMFHACLNSEGVENVPTWINEGTAWRIGLLAEQQVNPTRVASEMAYYEEQVEEAGADGEILPLTATETDIINAEYNVEYEDFMAVEKLVKQYGTDSYKQFIESLTTTSLADDFVKVFDTTISSYQNEFLTSIG